MNVVNAGGNRIDGIVMDRSHTAEERQTRTSERNEMILSKSDWFEIETARAMSMVAESKEAEFKGDFKAASSKARAVANCYLSIMEKLSTSSQPADREYQETLKNMISSTIDRAKSLAILATGEEQLHVAAIARHRQAMVDFLATEEAYHARLLSTRRIYLEPLEAELRCRPLVSRENIDVIFGSIDLMLQHSVALLDDLRPAIASESLQAAPDTSGGGGGGGGHQRFGPYPPPTTPNPTPSLNFSLHALRASFPA
jgi:hypothetical protein